MEKCLSSNQTQQQEKIPTNAQNGLSFRSYLASNILRTEIIFKSFSQRITPPTPRQWHYEQSRAATVGKPAGSAAGELFDPALSQADLLWYPFSYDEQALRSPL